MEDIGGGGHQILDCTLCRNKYQRYCQWISNALHRPKTQEKVSLVIYQNYRSHLRPFRFRNWTLVLSQCIPMPNDDQFPRPERSRIPTPGERHPKDLQRQPSKRSHLLAFTSTPQFKNDSQFNITRCRFCMPHQILQAHLILSCIMLILIPGITGMVGLPCAHAALSRGHAVRGLGRNPNKLPKGLSQRLESFVQSTSIYDIPALNRAVKGVDAIICAYTYAPEVVIEGQLLLLRAAERAGVKV